MSFVPFLGPFAMNKVPISYEARPTRMFGAYTLWASYSDGSHTQIAHGAPQYCIAEADRLNAELISKEAAERDD